MRRCHVFRLEASRRSQFGFVNGIYRLIETERGLASQLIAALVLFVTRMATDPVEPDFVLVAKGEHLFPQIGVGNVLAVPLPPVLLPSQRPAFGHAVYHVLRIGIERYGARPLERL